MTVRVVTAAQSAARDAAAIAAGVPSRALMRCAGMAAAAELSRRYPELLAGGVALFAGRGNNGGDAWVVAGALAAAGVPVSVAESGPPTTDDGRFERDAALALLGPLREPAAERIVVDGVLGTGARGEPRDDAASLVSRISAMRAAGARVVALDVPSGVDATSGAAAGMHVVADLTLSFGTMKRGLLLARDAAGTIAVLDIGLGALATDAPDAPELVDCRWVRERLPPILAAAHKGTRGRLTIVGGGEGMAGAAVLAARAAFRSGVGLVRLLVAPASVPAVQAAAPEAIAHGWSDDAISRAVADADALVIGPGLGRSADTRALVARLLQETRGPVLLDADALNVFEGESDALAALLRGRPSLLTPHPAEFARLAGGSIGEALERRFEGAPALAGRLGATVLLKGVPTVVAAPDGRSVVSASGTPALAVAGSGDVLSGVGGALLAQSLDPFDAGACAAWVHGRAGELAVGDGGREAVRGVTLDDVLVALGGAWSGDGAVAPLPTVLAELPAVGEGRR